jgi:hypothetical protein
MRLFLLLLVTLSCAASAQTYTISTIAGGALPANIAGISATFDLDVPMFMAADRSGNVFFVDQSTVFRLVGIRHQNIIGKETQRPISSPTPFRLTLR